MDFTRYGKTMAGVLTCMVISLLLQILGFATPGWTIWESKGLTWHIGLWYMRLCTGLKCEVAAIEQFDSLIRLWGSKDSVSDEMLEYQIETCVALATCVSGTLLIAMCAKQTKNTHIGQIMFGIAVTFCVVSGGLALVASGRYGHQELKWYNKNKAKPIMFPYSVVLTGLGGVFSCLSAAISVITYILSQSSRKQEADEKKNRPIMAEEFSTTIQHKAPHVTTIAVLK